MLTVVAIMFAGMLAGYLLRGQKRILRMNARLTMWVIYLLLFFLGLAIGGDEYIMRQLPELGLMALLITLLAVGGSLLTAWLLWRFAFAEGERNKP
ncbi:MAG: LysO family transporter [Bacteroidota bacterium]